MNTTIKVDANRRFREAEEAEQIAGHKLAEAVLRQTGRLIDWNEEWQRFYEKDTQEE